MAGKKDVADFERALTELEQLVATMEKGELTLEESLKAFETGVKLTRECQQSLRDAEQKVQVLLSDQGEPRTAAFESEDDDSQ